MSHLSPQTLTEAGQRRLLRVTAAHPRDHLILSLALGTGLRLAGIVGLDVGDVFFPDGAPQRHLRPASSPFSVLFNMPLSSTGPFLSTASPP